MARVGGMPLPTITDDRAIGEAVIQRSLRFRRGASTYLSRTPASQGDRRKFTISWWMKISQVTSSTNTIFSAQRSTLNPDFQINLYEHALIIMGNKDGNSSSYMVSLVTERLFRDPNNWYHCVVAFDTNDSTSSNRVKIYVNGDQVTDFAAGSSGLSHNTYPSSGDQTSWGTNEATQNIGRRYDGDKYFDGYLAEINYVDGSQLAADSFGFTDDQTGIWMPKRYEGGYGNVDNGFRLDFLDNSSTAALGIDKSPNGNDFTVSNHSVSASLTNDSMLDTPTNNFCILDHLNKTNSFTGKDGGLTFDQNSNDQAITGSFFVTSGKWYWEFYKNSGHNPEIGISVVGRETLNNRSTGFIDGRVAFISNGGNLRTGSSSNQSITGGSSQTGAGWLRIACDMDNKKIWFSDLSGNYFNSGNPATGANPAYDFSSHAVADGWAPYICMTTSSTGNGYPNFGQFDLNSFSSNIPAGFKTLTAKNLRDELLTNPSIVRPQKHFDTVLYTGDEATSRKISGLEFQPDLVWIKPRSTTSNHCLLDSVRGVHNRILPNSSNPNVNNTSTITAFNVDGFQIGNSSLLNTNSATHVAWCWKAGGNSNTFNIDGVGYATAAAAGLDEGTANPTGASVNTEAGFSIVQFEAQTTNTNITLSHGLGKKPEFWMWKSVDNNINWYNYHHDLGYNAWLNNSTSDAATTGNDAAWKAEPTSTVFTHGSGLMNQDTIIMYMWTSIPGYSKFGSYKGNGSSDGIYVHLGFKPAFLMVKKTSGANSWVIYDVKRSTSNVIDNYLIAEGADVDNTNSAASVDLLSNGFKFYSGYDIVNAGDYIYMAFAEQPGVTPFDTFSNAR